MTSAAKIKLVRAAVRASRRAVAPYSHFAVGAALLTRAGKIYTGSNIESVSYGLSCCAERVALFKALSDGEKHFTSMAVVAALKEGPMPCGACRQLLAEYAPDSTLLTADVRRPDLIRHFKIRDLLPRAFLALAETTKQSYRI